MNELRRLLEQGMSPEELSQIVPQNVLAQLLQEQQMPQPRYDIAPMETNTMRTENGPMAGNVIPLDFSQQQAQQQQPMRVAMMGTDGVLSGMGTGSGSDEKDVTRPIEIAGVGKGFWSKDGRSAIINGTKILMGVDRDASYREAKRSFDLKKQAQDLEMGGVDMAHKQEQTAALKAQRDLKEDTFSQAYLEKRFGKAEKGKMWTPDGRLVPVQGSDADESSKSGIKGAEETIRKIDEMVGNPEKKIAPHKGMQDLVGMKAWGGLPTMVGLPPVFGTDAADFKARLDEIKGGAFLQAFESLKGGGAITEVEGKKATDAITRMQASQSEAEFTQAAKEFRDVVAAGLQRAQLARGQAPAQSPQGGVFNSMPPASKYPGKRIEAPDGTIYKSDGSRWLRQ